jgi:hypothetical protein
LVLERKILQIIRRGIKFHLYEIVLCKVMV